MALSITLSATFTATQVKILQQPLHHPVFCNVQLGIMVNQHEYIVHLVKPLQVLVIKDVDDVAV
jgi:hypothetical protein